MPNEKRTFQELISEDQFDDSVRGDHQNQLRSEAFERYDQSKREAALVQPQRLSQHGARRTLDWNLVYGYVAIIAACMIGIVALFYRGRASTDDAVVNKQPAPSVTVDPQLIASLAALGSYREEVSPEEYFAAIAMCQTDHEGRTLFRSIRP